MYGVPRSSWFRQVVLFHCDNESVVYILNSFTSMAPDVLHLLHLILVTAAKHNFIFTAQNVAGFGNKISDAVSHFNWHADYHSTVIPSQLSERLITYQA